MFLQDTIAAAVIRDDDIYPGVRVSLGARLATARIKFSIDFNVGDPVVPSPIRTALPMLLGGDSIEMLAYPKAMVVAEKLVTALQRGRASTRWRDFADLLMLIPGDLVESEMIEALRVVAKYRDVLLRPLSEVLDGMAKEAQVHWEIWCKRQGIQERMPKSFAVVVDTLDEQTQAWFLKAVEIEEIAKIV